ncbi:hypothetical protein [Saccharopolyspora pogona]|uniref:hypothetical protein n=1 Tax=Saccharopolyspora pogona TaxID=333966 RepID=UPI0021DFB313|nr:hypothetical protein [Saccharopolyspora pogona]
MQPWSTGKVASSGISDDGLARRRAPAAAPGRGRRLGRLHRRLPRLGPPGRHLHQRHRELVAAADHRFLPRWICID